MIRGELEAREAIRWTRRRLGVDLGAGSGLGRGAMRFLASARSGGAGQLHRRSALVKALLELWRLFLPEIRRNIVVGLCVCLVLASMPLPAVAAVVAGVGTAPPAAFPSTAMSSQLTSGPTAGALGRDPRPINAAGDPGAPALEQQAGAGGAGPVARA